jgi:hypothetical protein
VTPCCAVSCCALQVKAFLSETVKAKKGPRVKVMA